jgi:uncharacterized Zn finger protein
MWDRIFPPYINAATRRAQAARAVASLTKKGATLSPVKVTGRLIARTFWGQAWCKHLESLSDYESRLPRGRTYLRNGSVLDLQITPGRIKARVMGSTLYEQTIQIAPLPATRWTSLKTACAGHIDSLVELLQGRLSAGVMALITDPDTGLFPISREIKKTCSCPDAAGLCKHLAAVLYGVGAQLDERPELLFVLRGVDHLDLIGSATTAPSLAGEAPAFAMDQLADVFGIELAEFPSSPAVAKTPAKRAPQAMTSKTKAKPKAKPVAQKIVRSPAVGTTAKTVKTTARKTPAPQRKNSSRG